MLTHYSKRIWAGFRRSPISTLINIFTLVLGLVCFILALGTAAYWNSSDGHFENIDRTFVVSTEWRLLDGSQSGGLAMPLTPHQLGAYLAADFPQIETIARTVLFGDTTPVRVNNLVDRMRIVAADPDFTTLFELPLLLGDLETALTAPGSAVLTKAAAQALFGDTSALGQRITLSESIDVTVTGVLDDMREPSHIGTSSPSPLRFDILVSRNVFETQVRNRTGGHDTTQLQVDWFAGGNTTYLLLPDDGSLTVEQLQAEFPRFVERHIPEQLRQQFEFTLDVVSARELLELAIRETLFPQLSTVSVPGLLLLLGVIVLAVSCLNYANLATARAASRAREVGLRRAIGARPNQIIVQYLYESAVLTTVSIIVAVILVLLLMPFVRNYFGIDMAFLLSADYVVGAAFWLLLLGAAVAFAAGTYPAFVLSRLQVVSSLRTASSQVGSRTLATGLVGVQFSLAAILLILLTIVYLQNEKLKESETGLASESLLVIENTPALSGVQHETLQQQLLNLSQVRSATTMEALPWTENFARMSISTSPTASSVEFSAHVYVVGHDFFETLDINLVSGRLFDSARGDDISGNSRGEIGIQNMIVSRNLAVQMGYAEPGKMVGQTVYIPASITGESRARPYHVIGVVEDKALVISSRYGLATQVYLFDPSRGFHLVRLSDESIADAVAAIDALWRELVPNVAINRRLVSDYFDDSYASFARVSQAFSGLSFAAWTISVIGLYAMAMLISNRRTHEIAIRKTLGASTVQSVLLLLKSFSVPVLIANLVTWPFAYIAGRAYLDIFSDPVPLTAFPFIIALIGSLLITWLVVSGHAWRAANTSPQQLMRSVPQ